MAVHVLSALAYNDGKIVGSEDLAQTVGTNPSPPGREGTFRVKGLTRNLPMAESSGPVRGLYEGHFLVPNGKRGRGMKVGCSLKTGLFGRLKAEAKGKVTVLDPTQVRTAVTTAKVTVVKTLAKGYSLFLPPGVLLETTGKDGSLYQYFLQF